MPAGLPGGSANNGMNTIHPVEIDIQRRRGDFSLQVCFSSHGGLTAFFGRSGSGKTSLVNLMAGLDTPDQGRISVNGQILFDAAAGINVPVQKRRLGYVFQDSRLFPHLNVRQNLMYGARFALASDPPQDFTEIVELLGLSGLLTRQTPALSGGEKQRVAIGRALLACPKLLLMDEPLASVDAGRKGEIISFIENLRDRLKIPIFYVSHAMDEVIRLADTMVVLDDGKAIATGGVEEIMSRLDLHPMTGRYEAGAVIPVSVLRHDDTYQLSVLGFGENLLWVPRVELASGESLRVRIRARDVALSRVRPQMTSLLNIFSGTVQEISQDGQPQAEILLDIGVPLIARITRKSVVEMDLKVGDHVFAMIKAAAIDRHSLGMAGIRSRSPG